MILEVQSSLSGNYKASSSSFSREEQETQVFEEAKNVKHICGGAKIGLQSDNSLYLVSLCDVVRIESSNNYCFIYLSNDQSIFLSKSLKTFEKSLSSYEFVRIHNSHIINLNYLVKITKEGNYFAILYDGNKLPISRRKFPNVMRDVHRFAKLVI